MGNQMMENKIVYLNGQYLPLDEAKVSVLDRGFYSATAFMKFIPSYSGHLFHFQDHLERLENSLAVFVWLTPIPVSNGWKYWLPCWMQILISIFIYKLPVVSPQKDHAFPDNTPATVFAMCSPIVPIAGLNKGLKAVQHGWHPLEILQCKAITLLSNILHRQEAIDQGCAEALLVKDGFVIEGAASNVFCGYLTAFCVRHQG